MTKDEFEILQALTATKNILTGVSELFKKATDEQTVPMETVIQQLDMVQTHCIWLKQRVKSLPAPTRSN